MQQLFLGAQDFVHEEIVSEAEGSDELPLVHEQVSSLCDHLISTEEIWPMMEDACGTHVLRSLILLISGADSASTEKSQLGKNKAQSVRKQRPESAIERERLRRHFRKFS